MLKPVLMMDYPRGYILRVFPSGRFGAGHPIGTNPKDYLHVMRNNPDFFWAYIDGDVFNNLPLAEDHP
jgi:hypothetical protein